MNLVLPALGKIIAYGFAATLGSVATWYFGRWAVGWVNEIKNHSNANAATNGRKDADSDDQKLNDQTDKLKRLEKGQ